MNEINEVAEAEFVDTAVVNSTETIVDPGTNTNVPNLQSLLKPARGFDEAYDDYCQRRKSAKFAVKHYLKRGTLVHNSLPDANKKGVTYRKPKEQ